MMKIPFVDLKAQYQSIREELDTAIATVIGETAFIGGRNNRFQQAFERAFSEYVGVDHVIGCGNGTDSMEILLEALGVGLGDEVIVPANSWISTSEVVTRVGAKPVFVDVLPDVYTINPALIEPAITEKTKVIIPVHLYGYPADMTAVMEIANRHNLIVLEDSAQAHGASMNGQAVTTFGHCGSYSFYPGKNLGAYGDAGAMVTNNPELAELARVISNHGQIKKYTHLRDGRNSRLDGLQSAVLTVKLKYLEKWTELRRSRAAYYSKLLADSGLQIPVEKAGYRHVYHLYVIQVSNREEVREYLSSVGVSTSVHYPYALPMLPQYKADNEPGNYPVSIGNQDRLLSLPLFPEMTETQINYVVEHLLKVAKP